MIRDHLVCGNTDPRIQHQLLQEPDTLRYDNAYKLAIALETASKMSSTYKKTKHNSKGLHLSKKWTNSGNIEIRWSITDATDSI